jgi:hypothetical protein
VLDRELLWGGCDGVLALMQQIPGWSELPLILTSSDVMPEGFGTVAGPPVISRLRKPYRLRELLVHLQACSLNGTPSQMSVVVQGGRP